MNTSVSEVLDRLAPESEAVADWDWVLRQAGIVESEPAGDSAPAITGPRSQRTRSPRRPILLGASVVVAAAVALLVVSPWEGGPTILERASAAISPRSSQVLYVDFGVCCGPAWTSGRDHTRLWVEGGPPWRFRSISPFSDNGGTLGPATSLGTQPVTSYTTYNAKTNTLTEHVRAYDRRQPLNFDPLTVVRSALAADTAHLDGRTQIDGEQAIRITLTTRDLNGRSGTVIYFADAKTFHPIKIQYVSLAAFSFPLEPIFARHGPTWGIRFKTFEYLRATPKNLVLTNIRAQHPNTRIVRCDGYTCTVIRDRPAK